MREIFSDTFVSRFHGERISRHIKFAIIRIFVNFDLTLIFFFVFLKLIFELPRALYWQNKIINELYSSSSYIFVFLTDNSRRPSRRRSGNHGKDALRRRRAAQWVVRENPLRRSPRLGGQQTTPERVSVS